MTYTPRPGTLPAQVLEFLQANPDEELDLEAISVKWSVHRSYIHTMLARLLDSKQIKRSRNDEGEYIYTLSKASQGSKAGTPSAAVPFPAPPAPPPARDVKGNAKGFTSTLKHIDIAALVVEDGVPFTPHAAVKGQSKWAPLFDKLTRSGQSVVIPGHIKAAVAGVAGKLNRANKDNPGAAQYRVAMVSKTEARVWRVA